MKIRFFLSILFFIFAISYFVFEEYNYYETRTETQKTLDTFDLVLEGIIENIQLLYNYGGILSVRVIKSNYENYDVRDVQKYYFCTIKGEKAEIIDGGLHEIQIGDSIFIDGPSKTYSFYRNKKLIKKRDIYIYTFEPLWEEVNKHLKLNR